MCQSGPSKLRALAQGLASVRPEGREREGAALTRDLGVVCKGCHFLLPTAGNMAPITRLKLRCSPSTRPDGGACIVEAQLEQAASEAPAAASGSASWASSLVGGKRMRLAALGAVSL